MAIGALLPYAPAVLSGLGKLFGMGGNKFDIDKYIRDYVAMMQEQAGKGISKQFSPYRAEASAMGRKEPQVGAQALAKVSAEQRGALSDVYSNIADKAKMMKSEYEMSHQKPSFMQQVGGVLEGAGDVGGSIYNISQAGKPSTFEQSLMAYLFGGQQGQGQGMTGLDLADWYKKNPFTLNFGTP